MSVTFSTDAVVSTFYVKEACLCAQDAPNWSEAPPDVLRTHAEADCRYCGGSGLETVRRTDEPCLNVANGNARALLALLGADQGTLAGHVALSEMRQMVLGARTTLSGCPAAFTRPNEASRAARRREDGVQEIVIRAWSCGLTEDRLHQYLDTLEQLIEYAEQRRGAHLRWG
jgi:hypothetical protein